MILVGCGFGTRVHWSSSDSELLEELQEEQRQELEEELEREKPREELREEIGEELEEEVVNMLGYTHLQVSQEDGEFGTGVHCMQATEAFVRSRRKWMEEGEKNTQYFFNLEKRNAEISSIIKLNINGQITDNPVEISNFVKTLFENLYKKKENLWDSMSFFSQIDGVVKQIDEEQEKMCDQDITQKKLIHVSLS